MLTLHLKEGITTCPSYRRFRHPRAVREPTLYQKQDDPRQGRHPSGSRPSVSGGRGGRTAAEQRRGREGRLKKTAETGETGRSTGGWKTLWEEEIRPRAPGASRLALQCGEASCLQGPGLDLGAGDGDDEKEGSGRQGQDAFETGLRRHTWFLKTLGSHEKPQSWQAPGCQG